MSCYKKIFFLFLCLTSFSLCGQSVKEVVIEGTAPFAKGENIRLIVADDYITHTFKTVTSSKIDNQGRFQLRYHTTRACLAQLAIRSMKAEFYIMPQRQYQFAIQTDSALFQLLDPTQYGGYLEIQNLAPDTFDINLKINRFSRFYERLLSHFGRRIISMQDRDAYDSLTAILSEKFPLSYNPTNFYETYIYYSYAQLDAIFWKKKADTIYHRYLDNEYLLYDNPAYMQLFNNFYSAYLYHSPRISKSVLGQYINEQPDYPALFNETGKDPFLVNARIRELAIISNLIEFYGSKEFNGQNILKLLHYILENTPYTEHKIILENAIAKCVRLTPLSLLPEPHFIDAKGNLFNIKQWKEKWIFLHFFDTSCPDCIVEMLLLKDLYEKYHQYVNFVSVSLDVDKARFIQFSRTYQDRFPWTLVNFNEDYDWIDYMEINSLPDDIMLSPDGTLYQRYFPDISMSLSRTMLQLFDSKEEEPPQPFIRRNK